MRTPNQVYWITCVDITSFKRFNNYTSPPDSPRRSHLFTETLIKVPSRTFPPPPPPRWHMALSSHVKSLWETTFPLYNSIALFTSRVTRIELLDLLYQELGLHMNVEFLHTTLELELNVRSTPCRCQWSFVLVHGHSIYWQWLRNKTTTKRSASTGCRVGIRDFTRRYGQLGGNGPLWPVIPTAFWSNFERSLQDWCVMNWSVTIHWLLFWDVFWVHIRRLGTEMSCVVLYVLVPTTVSVWT